MKQPIEILMIDDNPDDIRQTQDQFKDYKIVNTLNIVINCDDALAFLRKEHNYARAVSPDIVLFSASSLRDSGCKVLLKTLASEDLRHIILALMTSSEGEENALQHSLPIQHVFLKPLQFRNLVHMISKSDHFGLSIVRE